MLPSQFPTNQWVFVAGELNYGNIYGYVGTAGKLYTSGGPFTYPPTGNTITPTAFYIGKDPFSGETMPQGSMVSNFQVYNTTLDASSITALYQEGIGGAPMQPAVPRRLVAAQR